MKLKKEAVYEFDRLTHEKVHCYTTLVIVITTIQGEKISKSTRINLILNKCQMMLL